MSDVVIFRLKRLWAFDPEHLPDENAVCAKCGHSFECHIFEEGKYCFLVKESTSCAAKGCNCREFMVDLYKEIKAGRKTGEWRDASDYWLSVLFKKCWEVHDIIHSETIKGLNKPVDVTNDLKVKRAWLLVGFPKGNLPRQEADITKAFYYSAGNQFEIQFSNVTEIEVEAK